MNSFSDQKKIISPAIILANDKMLAYFLWTGYEYIFCRFSEKICLIFTLSYQWTLYLKIFPLNSIS